MPARALFGNLEDCLFSAIDEFAGTLTLLLEDRRRDFIAGLREPAQQRALAHDRRIGPDVRGGRRVARELTDVREAAGILEATAALEMLGYRDDVAGLALTRQQPDAFEDQPVVGPVEILGPQHIADAVPRGSIEHQAAEDGLLRLDGMGWGPRLARHRSIWQ